MSGPSKRRRGRPVLGTIAGLFFGIFLALLLVLLGLLPTNATVLAALPPAGLVLGAVLGRTAPLAFLRRGKRPAAPPAAAEAPDPAGPGSAPTATEETAS